MFFRTLVIPDLKFKASLQAGLRTKLIFIRVQVQPISASPRFSSSSLNLIFSGLSSAKISSFLVEFKLTKILSLLFHSIALFMYKHAVFLDLHRINK